MSKKLKDQSRKLKKLWSFSFLLLALNKNADMSKKLKDQSRKEKKLWSFSFLLLALNKNE